MTRFGGRYWSRRSCLSAVAFVACVLVALAVWQPLVPDSPYKFNVNVNFKYPSGRPQDSLWTEPSTNFIDLNQHPDLPSAPYSPYPAYNSLSWKSQWYGKYHACEGPQGPNGNTLELLHARSVSSSGKRRFPWVASEYLS